MTQSAGATAAQADRRALYQHPPRPEWVDAINREGRVLGDGVVPLDERSLIDTARANTGLADFGDVDHWLDHFRVLIESIEREAKLNLLGRLLTRSDLLIYLQNRLRVVDFYKRNPTIEAEEVRGPIFIVGLPRSGTTILHEVLGQDPQFRSVRKWEALFPCPPPQEDTYDSDPRIQLADELIKIQDRISPEWKSMHAVGGELPVECIEFTTSSFLSEMFTASFQIPCYQDYLRSADMSEMYRWHKKMVKLLQSRFKRNHWLFKGCNHEPHIAELLSIYPDARIIFTHRDPIRAVSSVVSVQGTIFGFRTDDPFCGDSYDDWLNLRSVAAMLDRRVDLVESGLIPTGQLANVDFAEFSAQPIAAIRKLYDALGLQLTGEAEARMADYLKAKPKHVFGAHDYALGERALISEERALFSRYQGFFNVPNEI